MDSNPEGPSPNEPQSLGEIIHENPDIVVGETSEAALANDVKQSDIKDEVDDLAESMRDLLARKGAGEDIDPEVINETRRQLWAAIQDLQDLPQQPDDSQSG
jgi:hypothetical protein